MMNLPLTQNQTEYVMSILANTLTGSLKSKVLNTLSMGKYRRFSFTECRYTLQRPQFLTFKCNLVMTEVKQLQL